MKIFFFFLLFFPFSNFAQIQFYSEQDSLPIKSLQIGYRFNDSLNFKITYTNETGMANFENNQHENLIEVKINYPGFSPFNQKVNIAQTKRIYLSPEKSLDEVCVTAQYSSTSSTNSVQKITIINTDQIRKSGAVNLADIINYQSGIRLSQDNILGTSLSVGGLSGENVKILIDGIPVIGRLNGSVDLSQINLSNVDRIEIIEGPLSVNYGTNALGGTINLITKKNSGKGISVGVNSFYENYGTYNYDGIISYQFKNSSITLSGGRNYFDGWKSSEPFIEFPKEKLADTNRFLTWKPKEQYFGEVRYYYQAKKWSVNPFMRIFDERIINKGFPKAPYFETALDDYYLTRRNDVGTIFNKNFDKSRLNVLVAYNYFQRIKNTYLNDLTTLNKILSETTGAQDTSKFTLLNIRAAYNTLKNKKFDFEVGIDFNYESAFGVRITKQFQTMGDYAFYSTCEYRPLKSLTIKPGLRYAYNTVYKAPLIPSLHLKYNLNKFIFRFSIAKGFRAPSLKELYFDFVDINHNIQGNIDLLAENSMNYHFVISRLHQTKKNLLLKFDLSNFYNDVKNLITLGIKDNNNYTYINVGKYKTVGSTFSFTMRNKRLQFLINCSFIGRYNELSNTEDAPKFNFSPDLGAQFSVYVYKEQISINGFYKYNGALQTYYLDSENNLSTSKQEDYHILDLGLQFKFLNNKLFITTGAKNIINVQSINVIGQSGGVHSSSNNMNVARGISAFISLQYSFSQSLKNEKN